MRRFTRFACIDWSGAKGARQKGIALAICEAGDGAPILVRPAGGWSREAALGWLRDHADDDMIVGIDFSASFPFADQGAFFPGRPHSPHDARALWALVEALSADEPHLAAGSFVDHPEIAPYFRRPGAEGALFGGGSGRMRVVERHTDALPASCFNLVGAKQVGKSSLTGMRMLHRLAGRVPIWPFDAVPARGALIVEIYTGIAARAAGRPPGRAKMPDHASMNAALATLGSALVPGEGPIDDHSSDAIVTAAWLRRVAHDPALWHPAALTAYLCGTEGWTFGVA